MTRLLHDITPGVLLLLGWLATPLVSVAADPAEWGTHDLGDGVTARLDAGGQLSLIHDGDPDSTLLVSTWSAITDGRGAVFQAQSREGADGGRRGFSAVADDDGDGSVDEDRLDGVDNDGDGLVDEDFAAVSQAMSVWSRADDRGRHHLETYHWTYPSLRRLVAVSLTDDRGLASLYQLDLPRGSVWQALDDGCAEAGAVFAAELDSHWLAVVALDDHPRTRSWERIRAADERLSLPLVDGTLTLAVVSGSTRQQVVQGVLAAERSHEGLTDPVTGARVAWLPPAEFETDPPPGPATVQADGVFGWTMRLPVPAADDLDLDPDRVRDPDGRPLSVTEVSWEPAEGDPVRVAWPPAPTAAPCPLGELLRMEGEGVLVLVGSQAFPEGCETLVLESAAGKPWSVPVEYLLPSADDSPAEPDWGDDNGANLQLSANLVGNYPNPFRFTTRISYRVPATVGEAFDLTAPDAPDLEPSRNMPYASDSPQVEVSVFSLEGRRVATLHVGRQSPGPYEVSWNGADEQGRSLPSGAYFCKLQIEKWSVTKRLIFVR